MLPEAGFVSEISCLADGFENAASTKRAAFAD
jgi:hypothetical protein